MVVLGTFILSIGLHMPNLELRIPPPLVAVLVGSAMWGVSLIAPGIDTPAALRMAVVVALVLIGAGFEMSGILAFRRAQTTVNPLRPDKSSRLVSSGVYRFTRNPMYVGLVFMLLAWAAHLSCAWAVLGLPVFVRYITRFQIKPEEKALAALFGSHYADYRARVRRWL